MTRELFFQAVFKLTLGIAVIMLLIFLPAGTWDYPAAWRLMAVLFVPMFLAGLVMMVKAPELLRRRLKAKENRSEQSMVIKLSALMFLGGFLLAGLDFRFGWSRLPQWVSWCACGVFLVSYGLYGEVLRENAWLSRTIEVQEGQKVVDTGLYGIVRHPMYSATVLLFLSMPLILGSIPALLVFLCYPAIILCRIRDEEALLEQELPGYREYRKKVKWRLLPWIW